MTIATEKIPLTQGAFAVVDEDDAINLKEYKWSLLRLPSGSLYAVRHGTSADGKKILVYMHRQILNAPPRVSVRHRDHDGLNNTRANLYSPDKWDGVTNNLTARAAKGPKTPPYCRATSVPGLFWSDGFKGVDPKLGSVDMPSGFRWYSETGGLMMSGALPEGFPWPDDVPLPEKKPLILRRAAQVQSPLVEVRLTPATAASVEEEEEDPAPSHPVIGAAAEALKAEALKVEDVRVCANSSCGHMYSDHGVNGVCFECSDEAPCASFLLVNTLEELL